MRKLLFILLSACLLTYVQAQTPTGFGTVLVESSNSDYESLPVINLRSSDYLTVSFDDLLDRDMALRYRVVHLNTDGTLSPLREIEYMDGINKTDITNTNLSFNTRTNYVHYEFRFPEGRRNVKVSGAFCFEVFEASDPDNVMLRIPFMVCEPSVLVDVDVKVPRRVEWRMSRQELAVVVDASECPYQILQADRTLKVFAQQNQNTTTIRQLPMLFQVGSRYEYRDKDEMVFDGLSEFRNFDIRPVEHSGWGVETTYILRDRWNALLLKQKSREYKPYIQDDDINGNYAVKAERMDNSAIEAEYVDVRFLLEDVKPVEGRDIYVVGKFNNWECTETNKMVYYPDMQLYSVTLPLKQGFYDYMYACVENGKLDMPRLEGNNQETENDYFVYVFYREPGGRYDKLLGVVKANSRDI